ncbi:MAG: hypothetical protein ACRELD_12990 [Longimicrobiales bacterium]
MADMDIQQKRRSIWPWVLGALAVVVAIWVVADMVTTDDEFADTPPAATEFEPLDEDVTAVGPEVDAELPEAVRSFRERCAAGVSATTGDDAHTANCLRDLAAALEVVIERGSVRDEPLDQRIDELREQVGDITEDAQSTQHSQEVQQAIEETAHVIVQAVETRAATTDELRQEAERVREAAEQIDATEPVSEQRNETAEFFSRADRVLALLAQTEPRN